jgi:hypothetical protein
MKMGYKGDNPLIPFSYSSIYVWSCHVEKTNGEQEIRKSFRQKIPKIVEIPDLIGMQRILISVFCK